MGSFDSGSFKLLGIQYSLAKDDRYISKFALSPEQMEKSDIIFKASFNEFSSSARDNVESSAYWLIRNSELLILIPLIFGLNFNAALSSSTAIINK
jgi:hypothetical protein